ncbi:RNA polymerase sigma factor [Flavobacteriaceae bacterium S356]|uniref:RNA polymerase sigma factor n=1 Tax=Asprobacillus argus TaxID=3076534 RepID=A0ABU3LFG6_9FLAO|nr:RNA polymerase sigma factor [Flavobacteriaceae bacterium S356]
MNERELIQQCKANHYPAQLEVYNRYKHMLFSSSVRILKSREDAEDVVQDSFIKGFQKIDQVKEGVTLGAWFRRIAVNASLDLIRKQKKVVWAEETNVLEKEYEDIEIEDDSGITVQLIKECINELKEKYRIVLVLYMIEDYNHREIGEYLNIKESTVRNQYKRGKSQLLELIQNKSKHELKRIFSTSQGSI